MCNNMKKFTIILLFCTTWGIEVPESCITPFGIRSVCLPMTECPELLPLLTRNLTEREASFLRLSICGYTDKNTAKVCCGPSTLPMPQNNNILKSKIHYQLGPDSMDPFVAEDSSPDGQCGIDMNGDRIIGGVEAELDEFPWMALLGYRTPQGTILYSCGGSLINRRFVLTAAHCIIGEVQRKVGLIKTVRLGEHDLNTEIDCDKKSTACNGPLQDIAVYMAVTHHQWNDYNRDRRHDIGLVMLARRVTYTFTIKPICLAAVNYHLDTDDSVYVAGWGYTLPNGTYSNVKRKIKMSVYDKAACVEKYKTLAQVSLTPNQICVGGKADVDSCKGDSGGPLMKRRPNGIWDVVGVVSAGYKGCAQKDWPGLYTSVAAYENWIIKIMKIMNTIEKEVELGN